MDCAIVCLQISLYFTSRWALRKVIGGRKELQSKVSEGFDSSFLPVHCRHCLIQLVAMEKCASHGILQYGTEDPFDRLHCGVVQQFQSNSI